MNTPIFQKSIHLLFLLLLCFGCIKEDDDSSDSKEKLEAYDFSHIHQGTFAIGDSLGVISTNIIDLENTSFFLLEQSPSSILEVKENGVLYVAQEAEIDFENDSVLSGKVAVSKGSQADTASYHIKITNLKVFESHWQLDQSKSIHLPLYEGDEEASTSYNFTVDWGDGTRQTITSYDDPNAVHTYDSQGEKIISIIGHLQGFNFSKNSTSKDILTDISAWGDVLIGNEGGYFYACNQLSTFTASDAPDLSETTRLDSCFFKAKLFNGELNSWDVSNITNMSKMFLDANSFNQTISTCLL